MTLPTSIVPSSSFSLSFLFLLWIFQSSSSLELWSLVTFFFLSLGLLIIDIFFYSSGLLYPLETGCIIYLTLCIFISLLA